MARVLLAGNSPHIARIAGLLRDWGLAVREHSDGPLTAAETHRSRADVVVVACAPAAGTPLCPLPSAFARTSAPILLVGGRNKDCSCRGRCWRRTREEEACGASLREALESCLGSAELPGSGQGGKQHLLDYVQFLNHEMRSPLSALQNALQILALDSPPGDEPWQHFLQVALRNARRLSETIDWNEEILSVRQRAAAPQWQWHELSTVCRQFSALGCPVDLDLVIATEADGTRILTDVLLLEALLRQVLRAVLCHSPGMSLQLVLDASVDGDRADIADATSPQLLSLTFAERLDVPAVPPAGLVARTGLISSAASAESADELNRLLACTVCHEAVQSLGARIVPSSARGDGSLLQLVLPRNPRDVGTLISDRVHAIA